MSLARDLVPATCDLVHATCDTGMYHALELEYREPIEWRHIDFEGRSDFVE
jgi:hypothetical protein